MDKENLLSQIGRQFYKDHVMNDQFVEFISENRRQLEIMLAYYRCAVMEIETKFKVLNEQFSLLYDRNPIESIKTRIKTNQSLAKKIYRKNIPVNLDSIYQNIHDIAGIRVVCSFPEDIYMLADCLLKQDDIILVEKRDYIKEPKPSGYRSLHLIVEVPIFLQNEKRMMKVEVQLRTIAMDFWATLEHKLKYKKNIPESEAEELAKELLECADISASLDARMEQIRKRVAEAVKDDEKQIDASVAEVLQQIFKKQ